MHWMPLPHRKYSWYSFILEDKLTLQPWGQTCQWKIPMTPLGIEPATYQSEKGKWKVIWFSAISDYQMGGRVRYTSHMDPIYFVSSELRPSIKSPAACHLFSVSDKYINQKSDGWLSLISSPQAHKQQLETSDYPVWIFGSYWLHLESCLCLQSAPYWSCLAVT